MHTQCKDTLCRRQSNVDKNKFQKLDVVQPRLIQDYNKFMIGVGRSDQIINTYNTLRKTGTFWKTVFYHLLDIARANSFILFKSHTGRKISQLNFNVELIRQLAGININTTHPMHQPPPPKDHPAIVVPTDRSLNCKLCYRTMKKEAKTKFICATCNLPFCLNKRRNCMAIQHYYFNA